MEDQRSIGRAVSAILLCRSNAPPTGADVLGALRILGTRDFWRWDAGAPSKVAVRLIGEPLFAKMKERSRLATNRDISAKNLSP
jgi:hypothetical protein